MVTPQRETPPPLPSADNKKKVPVLSDADISRMQESIAKTKHEEEMVIAVTQAREAATRKRIAEEQDMFNTDVPDATPPGGGPEAGGLIKIARSEPTDSPKKTGFWAKLFGRE